MRSVRHMQKLFMENRWHWLIPAVGIVCHSIPPVDALDWKFGGIHWNSYHRKSHHCIVNSVWLQRYHILYLGMHDKVVPVACRIVTWTPGTNQIIYRSSCSSHFLSSCPSLEVDEKWHNVVLFVEEVNLMMMTKKVMRGIYQGSSMHRLCLVPKVSDG